MLAGEFPLLIKQMTMLLLFIDRNDLLGDILKTFGNFIECSLLCQLDVLLQFLEFMFYLCDEAVLVCCDDSDNGLSETTAFEFII
jgi:hypothetical protein